MIAGLRNRDVTVFEYVYDHYAGALYGVVLRVVRNEEVAQEVLQDALLKIWDKIDTYDPAKGRLFTWMLNLTRNLAIDRTRSREMSQGKKTDDIDRFVHSIENQQRYEQEVDTIGLKEILQHLPDDQRFVLEHLYLKGYTQSELSQEFNIPLGTVKTRARMALIELRTRLNVK